MFGLFRYMLALLVVYGHFVSVNPDWGQPFNWIGHYSVWAFYLLSGYLMTLVLCQRYPATFRGVSRYLVNRALRIFPPYWAALGVSSLAILASAEASQAMAPLLRFPADASGWIQNVLILGLHNLHPARMISPAWSLSIELIFYGVMALGVSRFRLLAIGWLCLSTLGIGLTQKESGIAWVASLEGASLCFSLGAVAYHLKDWRPPAWSALPAAGFCMIHAVLAPWLYEDVWGVGLFVSISLVSVVVGALSRLNPRSAPHWISRCDRILGDLAYPIFLCHVQVGALTIHAFFDDQRPNDWLLLLAALPLIHIVAFGIHRLCEAPLVSWRDRIRSDADPSQNAGR